MPKKSKKQLAAEAAEAAAAAEQTGAPVLSEDEVAEKNRKNDAAREEWLKTNQ